MITQDYKQFITQAVLDQSTFFKLTLRGIVRGPAVPWQKIVVRPVLVRERHQLQFSYFDAKQDTSKNFYGPEAEAKLAEALAIPFSSITVQTTDDDIQIQITKKGRALIHRHRRAPEAVAPAPDLSHNHAKALPLPAGQPDAFLETLGITNAQGQIKPNMQGKFAQINEFLKLIDATGELERFENTPINVLDCGCGSAYLTFALYHYLNTVRGIPARLIGVDTNAGLIEKCTAQAQELQFDDLDFQHTPIIDFQPQTAPDLVLALHACDTATDEAIALAIRQDARMLVAAPCCHHELQTQLDTRSADIFRPLLRHGILKQRMGDLLTDTFRALALRIMGYKTDVIEFVASEHTSKNLMIRAIRSTAPGDQQFIHEYVELKQFWGVAPYIEQLLGEPFRQLIERGAGARSQESGVRS